MNATAQSATHTPGPWKAMHSVGAGWGVRTEHRQPGRERASPICSMAWFQFDIPEMNNGISEANARLIAAAPDLLDALERCRRYGDLIPELAGIADAAIAKATS